MQINLSAQNTIHLCEGGFAENFAVPITIGSTYNWTINGPSNIANITSGNGTEHILLDLNDTGEFWLCLLYTSPSPRDVEESRMPSSA